jgi:hypothetical protein
MDSSNQDSGVMNDTSTTTTTIGNSDEPQQVLGRVILDPEGVMGQTDDVIHDDEIWTNKHDKADDVAQADKTMDSQNLGVVAIDDNHDDIPESVQQGASKVEWHSQIDTKPTRDSVTSSDGDENSNYNDWEDHCATKHGTTDSSVTLDPHAVPVKAIDTSGKDDVSSGTSQASGIVQILSLLWKNGLTKYRTPVATFFELFSPLLMMLILAAAYQLSEITYEDSAIYASLSLDLPGPWFNLLNPQTIANLTDAFPTTRRRRSLLELDLERQINGEMLNKPGGMLIDWLEGSKGRILKDGLPNHASKIRRLQTFNNDVDEPSSERENSREIYSLLDDAQQQVRVLC